MMQKIDFAYPNDPTSPNPPTMKYITDPPTVKQVYSYYFNECINSQQIETQLQF